MGLEGLSEGWLALKDHMIQIRSNPSSPLTNEGSQYSGRNTISPSSEGARPLWRGRPNFSLSGERKVAMGSRVMESLYDINKVRCPQRASAPANITLPAKTLNTPQGIMVLSCGHILIEGSITPSSMTRSRLLKEKGSPCSSTSEGQRKYGHADVFCIFVIQSVGLKHAFFTAPCRIKTPQLIANEHFAQDSHTSRTEGHSTPTCNSGGKLPCSFLQLRSITRGEETAGRYHPDCSQRHCLSTWFSDGFLQCG